MIAGILRMSRWAFYGSSAALIVLFVVTPGLSLMDTPWSTLGIAVFSIFFTSLIALCLEPGLIRAPFENAALRWLGKISYGVYVYHLLLYAVFEKLAGLVAPHASPLEANLLLTAIAACGTLLIASVSFYTFESAFLLLKERLAGHSSGSAKISASREHVLSKTV